jgi:hypothetical protein
LQQIRDLPPEEVVRAEQLGQCEIVQTGRDPLAFERSGERRASIQEDADARAEQASAARTAANRAAHEIRRNLA